MRERGRKERWRERRKGGKKGERKEGRKERREGGKKEGRKEVLSEPDWSTNKGKIQWAAVLEISGQFHPLSSSASF